MSDMPPPPPDDPGWSSQPPPPPGPAPDSPQAMTGWATVGTGETVQLAGAGSRLGARIIDIVIIGVVFIILIIVGVASAVGLADGDSTITEEDTAAVGTIVAFTLLAVAISILYEVTMIATKGQTLGKMAVRIRVVRADNGLVPGWGKSIGRWIIPAALNFIPFVGWLLALLVYVSLLWDKVRQGWHDKAAGTLVIKV